MIFKLQFTVADLCDGTGGEDIVTNEDQVWAINEALTVVRSKVRLESDIQAIGYEVPIRDVNGNKIGFWTVEL